MKYNVNLSNLANEVRKYNKSNLRYFILTMGCQLNENDSEKIAGILEEYGYTKTEKEENADIIVFNTCCVRENAEDRLFGKLGEVKKYKEKNGTIIAIGGCMMQEEHIVNRLKGSYPFVDIIFGTKSLENFAIDLHDYILNNKKIRDIDELDTDIYEGLPISRNDNIKASVSIMFGCNNFCTYCIVPYVRGRERSREPQDIIDEVTKLACNNYKEIMLLGQNVNSYLVSERNKNEKLAFEVKIDKDFTDSGKEEKFVVNSFATLLTALDCIKGIERIRFISPHPKDFTEDVIDAIASSNKVCHMIHMPLQSGSTSVLKSMNRKYTKEQYLSLANRIRAKMPDAVFTTDIIVGFPTETNKDFEDTLDVVEKVRFEQIYMFIYSKRVGTPADKMENVSTEEQIHTRFDKLKTLCEKQITESNENLVNKEVEILVEGESKTNKNILTGRTYSNKIVNFEGDSSLIGKVIKVKIISQHIWYLKGIYDINNI